MKGPFPYLLLLFLLAAFLHAEFLLYVVYAMLIVVVVTRWWARRALGALVAVRRYESHAFLGDTIAVEIELHNGGRLPVVWVEVRESLPVDLAPAVRVVHALALAPRRRRTLHYELLGRRRGLPPDANRARHRARHHRRPRLPQPHPIWPGAQCRNPRHAGG